MKKLLLPLALLLATGASAQEQRPTTASSEVEYNQYGVAVKIDPLKVEAQDGFLVFRSKDTKYKLWLDCRVQADFAAFYGEDKDYDPIGNGASIRRARFAVKAQITKNWYGEVDMDMANGVFELKDAIIRYDGIRNTEIQIGNFKEFFSLQRNNTSRYLQFMERPMATQALAPSRHIGANIKWARKWMWLSGGVFFQTIDALETRTYVEDNNKDYGRNEGMSYTGKAVFMPAGTAPTGVCTSEPPFRTASRRPTSIRNSTECRASAPATAPRSTGRSISTRIRFRTSTTTCSTRPN